MFVRVQCPNPQCGKRYKVDASHAGRATVCKQCGQSFSVTAAPETAT